MDPMTHYWPFSALSFFDRELTYRPERALITFLPNCLLRKKVREGEKEKSTLHNPLSVSMNLFSACFLIVQLLKTV